MQARTPMLALVDADMLLSRHLYTDLLSQATQQSMMQVRAPRTPLSLRENKTNRLRDCLSATRGAIPPSRVCSAASPAPPADGAGQVGVCAAGV